jgi:hypothetical protein
MDRIDNPLDVAMSQLAENPENTALEIALKIAVAIPAVAIVDAIREHFLNRRRFERVKETLVVFQAEFEALQNESAKDRQRLDAISDFPKSAEFAEAVIAVAKEAVRSTNVEKIKRLGRVLANGSDPNTASSNDDDLTSFIHDVSQLSEGDIKVLEQLASPASALNFALGAQKSTLPESPFQAVIDNAEREKLLTEDFYSHCFRLVGFGLAAQIPGNSPSLALNNYSFRLTRRGHKLLALLKHRA